jgi:hypothetical protein
MSHQDKKTHRVSVHIDANLGTMSCVDIKIFSRFINNTPVQSISTGFHVIDQDLELGRFDKLMIQVGNLDNLHQILNTVRIEGIVIDGIDLNPHNVHLGRQYPDHTRFQHRNPVEYYEPGTHFDFAGVYELDIEIPIWRYALYAFSKLSPYRESLYTSNNDVS